MSKSYANKLKRSIKVIKSVVKASELIAVFEDNFRQQNILNMNSNTASNLHIRITKTPLNFLEAVLKLC